MLEIGYIALSAMVTILILIIGIKTIRTTFTRKTDRIRKITILAGSLVMWHVYMFVIASSGILLDFEFPPRFALFLIFPAFLFTGIFIYTNRKKSWIQNIPEHWLIYYQTFRILIETLFIFSVAGGVLTYVVTLEGYNYDMVFAITAPLIAWLTFQQKRLPLKAVLAWNYLGLIVIAYIIFLFQSTIYLYDMYGADAIMMPMEFVKYPYVMIAGFLMPSAVFMHVLSIVQLSKKASVV